jgi:hypothetical protein
VSGTRPASGFARRPVSVAGASAWERLFTAPEAGIRCSSHASAGFFATLYAANRLRENQALVSRRNRVSPRRVGLRPFRDPVRLGVLDSWEDAPRSFVEDRDGEQKGGGAH